MVAALVIMNLLAAMPGWNRMMLIPSLLVFGFVLIVAILWGAGIPLSPILFS